MGELLPITEWFLRRVDSVYLFFHFALEQLMPEPRSSHSSFCCEIQNIVLVTANYIGYSAFIESCRKRSHFRAFLARLFMTALARLPDTCAKWLFLPSTTPIASLIL